MSYGSNQAVEDGQASYREACAKIIAEGAAELVAAGDLDRRSAIGVATEWLRSDSEVLGDPTGTIAAESRCPKPSRVASRAQVAAIAAELYEAARDAADSL